MCRLYIHLFFLFLKSYYRYEEFKTVIIQSTNVANRVYNRSKPKHLEIRDRSTINIFGASRLRLRQLEILWLDKIVLLFWKKSSNVLFQTFDEFCAFINSPVEIPFIFMAVQENTEFASDCNLKANFEVNKISRIFTFPNG